MNTLLLVLALACVAFATLDLSEHEIQQKFQDWVKEHGKVYQHDAVHYRYRVWKKNLERVTEHNARTDVTFKVEMNKFADLTAQEFAAIYNGVNKTIEMTPEDLANIKDDVVMAVPSSWDWRTYKVPCVTPVKDQGQCGSCWSFSTTGVVEGAYALAGHGLVSSSEQQLVDCDTQEYGCNGGWPIDAMNYLVQNGGSDTESCYPYTAKDGSCHSYSCTPVAKIAGYSQVQRGDESALQTVTYEVGPVSVCIDASNWSFQLYSSGVYYEPNCSSWNLDHAVLVVGYGSDSGSDYWIVKNSWGTGWGQSGYIWMARNRNNNCGIASSAVSASSN